jgi:manganese efflux pump family protein
MEWAALISWVVTAGGGFVLLAIWLGRGGMRQREGRQIRPLLILSHFALAATGLVLWIIYVVNDSETLAWIAFALLVAVALLGWTMFAIWWQRRQAGAGSVAAPEGASPGQPAEQHFPVAIVAVHGLLAVTTVVLVLLAALEV